MRFTGTLEELRQRLNSLDGSGEWKDLNPNQIQFRHESGGILNWFPSTGTINIQGRPGASDELKAEVERLLTLEQPAATETGPLEDAPFEVEAPIEVPVIPEMTPPQGEREGPPVTDMADQRGMLDHTYSDSELVIGLVGAVGTELDQVTRIMTERLQAFNYSTHEIRISRDIISTLGNVSDTPDNFERISSLMSEGNRLRQATGDASVLALAVAAKINQYRTETSGNGQPTPLTRKAFIINSLKHPDEVQRLRKIYSNGFFLIGVYADERRRFDFLTRDKRIPALQAQDLIERDADESDKFGQHTRDTYHLSDFFINFDGNSDKFKNDNWRVLDLIFGKPYVTPTFDEFAMFMAFSASLRSADLSRQVGAVVTKNGNIISTGANDIPKAGGGLYWPKYDDRGIEIGDEEDGRDYKRGFDSNAVEKRAIIDDILRNIPDGQREAFREYLKGSRIKDITEYGRVVHAEMEAILACARSNIGTKDAELFCTTFPCHNCAKHIIASGIKRVVYVEPYPKSKAFEFHSDSISVDPRNEKYVLFEPFVGVGPRSFFNLFSTSLGSGYPVIRKTDLGEIVDWQEGSSALRMQMLPSSYIERETLAASIVAEYMERINVR